MGALGSRHRRRRHDRREPVFSRRGHRGLAVSLFLPLGGINSIPIIRGSSGSSCVPAPPRASSWVKTSFRSLYGPIASEWRTAQARALRLGSLRPPPTVRQLPSCPPATRRQLPRAADPPPAPRASDSCAPRTAPRCTNWHPGSTVFPRACHKRDHSARRQSSRAISARLPDRCSTTSICTWQSPPCPTRSCAAARTAWNVRKRMAEYRCSPASECGWMGWSGAAAANLDVGVGA